MELVFDDIDRDPDCDCNCDERKQWEIGCKENIFQILIHGKNRNLLIDEIREECVLFFKY